MATPGFKTLPRLVKPLALLMFAGLVVFGIFVVLAAMSRPGIAEKTSDGGEPAITFLDSGEFFRSRTAQCDDQNQEIWNAIDQSMHCANDSDCGIYELSCPFGCRRAIRKDRAELIQDLIDAPRDSCNSHCSYCCIIRPGDFDAACVKGQCRNRSLNSPAFLGHSMENGKRSGQALVPSP